jgi:hypothetical protein
MGDELFSGTVRIKRFLGLNTKLADTAIDLSESSGLQNVNITPDSLEQRRGSEFVNTNAFQDKGDSGAVSITGLYETTLSGNKEQVGVGGDAFREFDADPPTNRTGAVTITSDDDNLVSFATFFDSGAANEIMIIAPDQDTPFKWTGSGNAAALASTPGDFRWPVVKDNKLWVAVDDIVYFSGLRDAESWDTVFDLVRFAGNGENISGLASYAGRIVVFKPKSIHAIYGSSNRDIYIDDVVTGEGCASGYSIQEIESRRYGSILAFMSNEGIIKGFNGTKDLLLLGDPAKPLFDDMNQARADKTVGVNHKELNQYWCSMSFGSQSTHSQLIIYDYFNDIYTDQGSGRQLSTILYHIGINANAMTRFTTGASSEYTVTGDYSGFAFRQNIGLLDEAANTISSKWQTGKVDYGAPDRVKMITDLNVQTTQSTATNLSLTVASQNISATSASTISVDPAGGLWGSLIWGTGLWSAPSTRYTRAKLTRNEGEGAMIGRYFIFQLNHSTASEAMEINELLTGVSDLGIQPEYVE